MKMMMSPNTTQRPDMSEFDNMTDEEYYEKLVGYRNSGINFFAAHNNITRIALGYAEGRIDLVEHHGNPIGSVHGGCIFSLADSVGGAAAVSRRRAVTTVSSNINYVNAAMMDKAKALIATATEIKAGKSTCVYRVDVKDESNRLIATAVNTYFYLKSEIKLPGAD